MAPGGEWLAVFTRAGFDQTQARQALGELPVTRQPDGSLDAVDISTAAASGEYPTFIQTLIDEPIVSDLVEQYVRRTVDDGGIYRDVQRGIPLGCSLSPLMGAVYLQPLDDAMQKTGLFYARFMDDWVVFAPSRWKLRKVVRIVNQVLNRLKVWQHPDKTFVGRVDRGFDFLGYHFRPDGLSVAEKTRQNFVSRVNQLYEQQAIPTRIDGYVRRWTRWVNSGLGTWTKLLRMPDGVSDEIGSILHPHPPPAK